MTDQSIFPFVSIVVIVLNGAGTIAACLDALSAQNYPPDCFEIVVVDNGSTDGTQDIVLRHQARFQASHPVRLVHEPSRGFAPARNAGVKAARGEIIAFTDSDCLTEPDWLVKLTGPLCDPMTGIVGGDIAAWKVGSLTLVEEFIDQSGFVGPPRGTINGLLSHVTTANVVYRKALIERAGYFNTRLLSCEDVDLSRIVQTRLKAKAVLVLSAVVYHRHYSTVRGLYKLSRRNGHGEILMATRWKDVEPFRTSLTAELRQMLRQFFALFVYLVSFAYRSTASLIHKKDRAYRTHPLLWFIAEGATLLGKIQGLIDTRFLKEVPLRREGLQR